MSKHTNFRLGGPAKYYYVAQNSDALIEAVQQALQEGIPYYLFGGGSNILVSDDGFDGLMIQAANRNLSVDGDMIQAEAGALSAMVARKSAEAGLTGFEWAIGVPGTVGGGVYGNAGCFGGEYKDAVQTVDAYDVTSGKRVSYSNQDCQFGYRDSRFKHEPHIILGCSLQLAKGNKDEAMAELNRINAERKAKQPLGESSAGCMFKNFGFADQQEIEKLMREVEVPQEFIEAKRIPAGWLVDKLGLRGKQIGKVKVSDVHGNFLVSESGGRSQDVIALTSLVKMKVRDDLGILLQDEVQLVGFN